MRILYWARTDLRCRDNQALAHFCAQATEGAVIWCPSSTYQRAGQFRKAFVDDCLSHFSISLQKQGQILMRGTNCISEHLSELISRLGIQQVVYTREFATEESAEEKLVSHLCNEQGVSIVAMDQSTLISESDLPFTVADMPFVFTSFRKKIESSLMVRAACNEPTRWPELLKIESPEISRVMSAPAPKELLFQGGESQALARLEFYLWSTEAVRKYKETRNGMLHWDDSTKFSAWLNQGCLSARTVFHELKRYEAANGANESTYWVVFELLWRDYFKFLSRRYEEKIFHPSGLKGSAVKPHSESAERFEAWKQGKTGNPFIDANMIELRETGWMSNRGRQNVASYLIHSLEVPWTWGAAYFENQLIDYDPDVNWGNWLYLSGKGTDPRARVFNPLRQAEQYDPSQEYQRKWKRLDP